MGFGPPSDLIKKDEKPAAEEPDLILKSEPETTSEGKLENTWNYNSISFEFNNCFRNTQLR